jgi:hypothetical protein
MKTYCALCGAELLDDRYSLAVVILHKSDPSAKPKPLAQTREICDRCAHPAATAELQTTLRRIPSILPGAY